MGLVFSGTYSEGCRGELAQILALDVSKMALSCRYVSFLDKLLEEDADDWREEDDGGEETDEVDSALEAARGAGRLLRSLSEVLRDGVEVLLIEEVFVELEELGVASSSITWSRVVGCALERECVGSCSNKESDFPAELFSDGIDGINSRRTGMKVRLAVRRDWIVPSSCSVFACVVL